MKGDLFSRLLLYIAAGCCGLSFFSDAYTQNLSYCFRPGMRISQTRAPTTRELNSLMRELAFLSGLDLKVDSNGSVHYDRTLPVSGGSAIARELLETAIDSSDSFIVESANRSARVAFAQIESTLDYDDGSSQRHKEWVIRIDFFDFAQLRGDDAALRAFSPGTTLLHELTHSILKLPDPETPDDPLGPCERHLNLIRAELDLPLRQNYVPKNRFARIPDSLLQTRQAEFIFSLNDRSARRAKQLSLTFNIVIVVDTEKVKSNRSSPSDLVALRSKL